LLTSRWRKRSVPLHHEYKQNLKSTEVYEKNALNSDVDVYEKQEELHANTWNNLANFCRSITIHKNTLFGEKEKK